MASDSLSVFDLSPAEKLQLVEDLWDDLAADPANIPEHEWQLEEVERRAENLKRHPATALTGEDIQRRIRTHYGR